MAEYKQNIKSTSAAVEHHLNEKNVELEKGGDYSGAVKKTSGEEIKLVRKLDWRIMSTLWAMYFLVSTEQCPCKASIS